MLGSRQRSRPRASVVGSPTTPESPRQTGGLAAARAPISPTASVTSRGDAHASVLLILLKRLVIFESSWLDLACVQAPRVG